MGKIEAANVKKGMDPSGFNKAKSGGPIPGATHVPGDTSSATSASGEAPTTSAPTTSLAPKPPSMSDLVLIASEPSAEHSVGIIPGVFAVAFLTIGLTSFRRFCRPNKPFLERPLTHT